MDDEREMPAAPAVKEQGFIFGAGLMWSSEMWQNVKRPSRVIEAFINNAHF